MAVVGTGKEGPSEVVPCWLSPFWKRCDQPTPPALLPHDPRSQMAGRRRGKGAEEIGKIETGA